MSDAHCHRLHSSLSQDNTLLRTSSGRKFPVGRNDWAWLLACIPAKLRALHNSGWKVVIFTNQNGISTGNQSAAEIKGKILDIIKDCGVPMSAFIASADDLYRKPATHGWQFMIDKCNGGIQVDLTQSIYVGDAAGRPAMWDGSAATKVRTQARRHSAITHLIIPHVRTRTTTHTRRFVLPFRLRCCRRISRAVIASLLSTSAWLSRHPRNISSTSPLPSSRGEELTPRCSGEPQPQARSAED